MARRKSEFRSGLVALVGKPNVGKSTLLNALVGSKVAITSRLPQTTRRRVLGVVHRPGYQIVLVDTPGVTVARHELGKRMAQVARNESRDADLVLFLGELTHAPTEEDREALKSLGKLRVPIALVGSKLDKGDRDRLAAYRELAPFEAAVAVSAVTGEGLPELLELIASRLQPGPPFYPEDQVSDQNQRLLIEEVIREKVLDNLRQEVPHAVAVQIEDLREGETLYVAANLYVERAGQKGIVIGKGGEMLKKIGQQARQDLEKMLGTKVFLELWVKVKEDWRDRSDWLRSLGFE